MPIEFKLRKKDKKAAKNKEPKRKKLDINIKLPSLNVSQRDKNLLILLFAVGVIAGLWQFGANPMSQNLIDKQAELDAITQELFTARLKAAVLEKNKAELAELKQEQTDTGRKYFYIFNPEEVEKFNQEVFIAELSKKLKAAGVTEGSVSYRQPALDQTAIAPMAAADTGYSFDFTGDYKEVMALLAEFEKEPKNMSVESLSLSSDGEAGITDDITGSITVKIPMIYTPYMELEPDYDFDWESIKRGKVTPFDSTGIVTVEEEAEENGRTETEKAVPPVEPTPAAAEAASDMEEDFFLSVMADAADFDSATFGMAGDASGESYISVDKNDFADAVLIFETNEAGVYFYRAEIDGVTTGAQPFIPKSDEINLKIFSMLRQGAGDFSAMRLHVENKTNTPLNIQILGDDPTAPRVNFSYRSGIINVEDVK